MAVRSYKDEHIRQLIDSPDYKNPWLIGYWLGKHYEGHGYVTEACSAMLDWGTKEMGIDCYFAQIYEDNTKSRAVVKRLGFEFWCDCTLKEEGAQVDHVYRKMLI